jgi:hypothetical protein
VGEYQKAGVMSTAEGRLFSVDAEFWKKWLLLLLF